MDDDTDLQRIVKQCDKLHAALFIGYVVFILTRYAKPYVTACWLLVPLFFVAQQIAFYLKAGFKFHGLAVLILTWLILLRFFYGPYDAFLNWSQSGAQTMEVLRSDFAVVVLTIFESDRGEPTIEFVKDELKGVPLVIDRAHAFGEANFTWTEEFVGWDPTCEYAKAQWRSLAYSVRWKSMLLGLHERFAATDRKWVLILEDDAEPNVDALPIKLAVAAKDETYDLIWLDSRNFWSDFVPLRSVYIGTAGSLVRVESLAKVAACFRFSADYCWMSIMCPGNDNFLSVCCKYGIIKCHSRPYIRERGTGSILNGPRAISIAE